ncbi:methyl-viologen-reducing hydrogenase subunit delta [Candidatus Geothermarchaeota archaeon ex4572_27]|nr:MAG: methyl-viologen-reducing hydrogenase subunit delta [Candidatus Geothermarchaeota archaeon ex4572_27]
MSGEKWEPKIVVFACNWCSYAGMDLAGTSRKKYPPNPRVIRVMCSSRVSPEMVIKALADGADGVLITGCHPGDCHYVTGNYQTMKRYHLLKKMLDELGFGDRVRLEWISASEADKYVKVITEFVEHIRKLGPIRFREEVVGSP